MSRRNSSLMSPTNGRRMSIASLIVAAAARSIPRFARERYREEWQADLDGARELHLSDFSVASGAVVAALSIDRTDPRISGLTRSKLMSRRARWALAFLSSATVLGVGLYLGGGYQSLTFLPVAPVLQTLTIIFTVAGLFASLGTLLVVFGSLTRRTVIIGCAGILVILLGLATLLVTPLTGILVLPLLLALAIIGLSGPSPQTASVNTPVAHRLALVAPFSLLTLAVIALGILHITVWNPLAKVPEMSLDKIYAAMAAANETPLIWPIVGWASMWGAAAILLPVVINLPWLRPFFTARRTVVTSLLMVGAASIGVFFASFNMGMSLADTFMTSGADSAVSGSLIALLGQITLVAAMLIGLSPRRLDVDEIAPHHSTT